MKVWAKLVACFLIAWLPLLGYPAQPTLCPAMSSVPNVHLRAKATHSIDTVGCEQVGKHHASDARPACHGNMGGFVCGMPAIPTTNAVVDLPSSPVYRALARTFAEQFIPELPAPPPRAL